MADVELILDDGTRENGIGIIGGDWEFIFLNRFTPDAGVYPFTLDEIDSTRLSSITTFPDILISDEALRRIAGAVIIPARRRALSDRVN